MTNVKGSNGLRMGRRAEKRLQASRRLAVLGVALVAAATAAACGSSDSDEGLNGKLCNAGDTRECLGPAACKGAQACVQGGAEWTACDCGGGGSGGASGFGGSSVGGASGAAGTAATGATGGAGAGGGVGGVSAAAGTAGSSGTTGGGGNAGAGNVGGGGAAGSAGAAPGSDPCPTFGVLGVFEMDCQGDCGGPTQPCDPARCSAPYGSDFALTDNAPNFPYVLRTPSTPGVDPQCTPICGLGGIVYSLGVNFQIPYVAGKVLKATVTAPWSVWIGNDSVDDLCFTGAQNGCALSVLTNTDRTVYVTTTDPNAPARNVYIEQVAAGSTCP